MDEFIYLVEYWDTIDSSGSVSVVGVHKTVFGAETRARELINEQIIDNNITPEEQVAGFSRDGEGMLKVTLNTPDLKYELESWTVVRTKIEE